MGLISFEAASMFGSLSDVIGTKSGLALDRQQLGELLARDDRFETFRELDDDDWVRIESTTFEEIVEFLLFSVGRLERVNNLMPIAGLYHRYKGDSRKMEVVYAISQALSEYMNQAPANPNLQRGDKIDPSPFMIKCFNEFGKLGLEISHDLITNYAIQLEIRSSHFPTISQWSDIVELSDLFESEGLDTEYGKFFDQRYIDFLHRNFADIDRMNWRKFEGLTAEFFNRQGFRVDLGPGRNDDGIDVRIFPSDKSAGNPPTIIVQCKRQKQSVSKVIVKALYADLINAGATSGLIVTTSKLSPGARAVRSARQYPIVEAERETLRLWIAEMRKPGMGTAT